MFFHSVTIIYTVQCNVRVTANPVYLMFSGQQFLWFASDLHVFYWLVRDLGRKPELMPPLHFKQMPGTLKCHEVVRELKEVDGRKGGGVEE